MDCAWVASSVDANTIPAFLRLLGDDGVFVVVLVVPLPIWAVNVKTPVLLALTCITEKYSVVDEVFCTL
jgi:hypothetical protein